MKHTKTKQSKQAHKKQNERDTQHEPQALMQSSTCFCLLRNFHRKITISKNKALHAEPITHAKTKQSKPAHKKNKRTRHTARVPGGDAVKHVFFADREAFINNENWKNIDLPAGPMKHTKTKQSKPARKKTKRTRHTARDTWHSFKSSTMFSLYFWIS